MTRDCLVPPRPYYALLRTAGIDTVHVGEIGYHAAEDTVILQLGKDEGRAVVTLDAAFMFPHAAVAEIRRKESHE